ncbi:MAG: chemotaxis protein CheB [Nostoc sp.]|uniref:chemotaxis protein CheB n=1 Tax=Nostoc sp. TaxID=1180 RepID=UPI002FF8B347
MGQDGAQGLSLLRSQGWHTIPHDEESSLVYGMPKAAVEILPPEAIAANLIQQIMFINLAYLRAILVN